MVVQSIPLITDLRTQNRNIGILYVATGQTTPGDNNGGMYMWNPSSTAADDSFYVLQVTGVATGRWLRIGAASNIYTANGSLIGNRTVTLNGYTLNFTGSTFSSTFLADGTVSLGSLVGTGTRYVVAGPTGLLGATGTIPTPGTPTRFVETFTASAGQTTFNTANTLFTYFFDVYLNGVLLDNTSYTASANQVVLTDPCSLSDIVQIIGFYNITYVGTLPPQAGNAGRFLTTDGTSLSWAVNPLGTVTSVDMSVPTGFAISGNPVTSAGTLALAFAAGYSLPANSVQANWTTAYNRSLTSAAVTGTSTKTLTLNEQDGSTITATWSDYDTQGVTSVSTNVGTTGTDVNSNVINPTTTPTININVPDASATSRGALTSTDWTTFNNKQAAISLTTVGSSGAATFIANVLNIPNYGSALSGYVPTSRTLTINGTTYDLTANRTWSVGTVTSVDFSVPTGFAIANNPITTSGTLALSYAVGYALPTTASQGNWDTAYTFVSNFPSQTGNAGKYLTTDGSVLSWAVLNLANYVPTSRTLTINGTTYDLSADRTWTIVAGVSSVAGTAPISAVNVSGAVTISISQSSASADGYLSSADWSTFNAKQPAGNYITSLTGEATASGPGAASVTLTNSAVIGKVLTGLNVTGGSISATDSILAAFGKIQNQINGLVGGLQYQGTWNANTNTPTLSSGVGTNGHFYIVSVAGSTNLDGITDWKVGDWAVYHASSWQKVDNTESVTSVNGFTGAVSLTTSNISEGTNLYYTDSRARQAISLTTTGTSGAATYDNTTGVLNIPQYQGGVTSFNTRTGAITLLDTDVTGALGYTPVTNARTLTINGTSYDLSANRTWSVGTVTSVGLTMPAAFTVTNSPVTGSGTLTVAGAGTASQYIDGTGALQTFPTVVDSGALVTEVYNNSGATLTKGTIVYITGGQGNLPTVSKALATGDATSAQTFGFVRSDITNMNNGFVIVAGKLGDLNTNGLGNGTQLYLSPTTAGQWTTTKPLAPNHLVYVGIVVRDHPTQGVIEVIIQNGYELYELHDVQVGSYGTKDVLYRDTSTNLWKNIDIFTLMGAASGSANGYLTSTDWTTFNNKVPATRSLSINGVSYDLSADRSWTIGPTIYSRGLQKFTATAGQTTFTITNGYTVGLVDVYRNGVKLDNALEFTASNGTTVVLTDAAALNDVIEVYKYGSEYIPNNALRTVSTFTATAAQTTFSVTYSVGLIDVFYNGAKLAAAEYTATNGTTVVLASACVAGDIVEIIAYSYLVNGYSGISGSGNSGYIPKFTGTSAIGNSNIQDSGTLITLGGNSYVNGSLGVGVTSPSTYSLAVGKNMTGGTNVYGVGSYGTVQSDATNSANAFISGLVTAAATFTLTNYRHFYANQSTIGAGSTVTNQNGFVVDANMIGATNNFGFRGGIPSGTNRWNLYMDGTAANYLAGSLNIGTTSVLSDYPLNVQGTVNGNLLMRFANTSSGTSARLGLILNTDFGTLGSLDAYGTAYNIGSTDDIANGVRLFASGAGGLSLRASNASGTIRFYNGSTESARFGTNGALGIGTTSLTGYNLRVSKNLTGSVSVTGIYSSGAIQSDVTSDAQYFSSGASTAAAAFTVTDLAHFIANQGTFGAGSTVTKQYGFRVAGGLTGATNNYAFFSDIASGANRWNLYMNGTANNYMAGALGIGATGLTGYNLRISINPSAATAYGIMQDGLALSSVTTSYHINRTLAQTQAATFSLSELVHYYATQGTFGAGSSVGNQYGFIVGNLTGATNNYGFYGNIASGANRFNLYMNGTAANYLAGKLLIGSTTDSGEQLQVTGTAKITGAATFSSSVTATGTLKGGGTNYLINTSTGTDPVYQRILTTGGDVIFGIASSTGTSLLPGVGNYATVLYNNTNTDISFGTNQLLRMTITSGGNVGINTTTINDKLDVYGNIRTSINTSYYAVSNYLGTNYYLGSSETTDNIDFKINGGGTFTSGGNFRWFTQAGGATPAERMRLKSDGQLLMDQAGGNSWKLYINQQNLIGGENGIYVSSGYYPAIHLSGNSGTTGGGKWVINSFATGYGSGSLAGAMLLQSDKALQFSTNGDNIAMTINTSQNVLIGTTTDSGARLTARFASSGNPTISATNTNASNSRCYYGQKASGSTDDYYMIFDNAVDNKFLFYGNGGLGNVQANNVNISDERTKKYIIPLESYWDKIKAIEIVKFKYKDQTHDDFNIGVIAQQVEAVAPEFVEAEDWGKDTPTQTQEPLKSVYTTDLYHATIKVLQEAMAKIEVLESELALLKNK